MAEKLIELSKSHKLQIELRNYDFDEKRDVDIAECIDWIHNNELPCKYDDFGDAFMKDFNDFNLINPVITESYKFLTLDGMMIFNIYEYYNDSKFILQIPKNPDGDHPKFNTIMFISTADDPDSDDDILFAVRINGYIVNELFDRARLYSITIEK